MPQPIILPDPSGLAAGITSAGSALGQALGQRAETQKEQRRLTALQSAIAEADFSTEEGQRAFLMQAVRQKMDPAQAMKIITEMRPSEMSKFFEQYGDRQQPLSINEQPTAPLDSANPNVIETAPTPAAQHPATKNSPFARIPDEALVKAAASKDKQLAAFADAELKYRDSQHKYFTEDRTYHTARSKKYMESIDELRKHVRSKRAAVENIKWGVKNRDLSMFTQDWWAQRLGDWGKGMVTPEGALVHANVKEFLLGDLGRITGRPNVFIEQRILGMMPQIGQTEEANLTMAASTEQQLELEEKKIELTDQLSEQYEKELGFVPGNISRLTDRALEPYAKEAQEKLAYRVRELQEKKAGFDKLSQKKAMPGTPLTIEMAAYLVQKYKDPDKAEKIARQLGYIIPTEEQIRRYKQ